MFKSFLFTSLSLVFFLFLSCKKDEEIKPATPPTITVPVSAEGEGKLVFNFKALVNGQPLVPDTEWYTNASMDSFTVSKFNYYISNVKLTKEDGTVFYEKNSYHLNKHVGGSESFTMTQVPAGTYKSIDFLIGVDSLKNVSGAQSGILNEGEDMYWTWSTGYIFYKLEGKYKTIIQTEAGNYGMHIGGFQAGNNCLRSCTFDLKANPLALKKDQSIRLFIKTKVEQVFNDPNPISLNEYSSIFTSKMGQTAASNYQGMFEIDKIEN